MTLPFRTAHLVCEFGFEASHRLRRDDWSDERNEATYGRCVDLHGHSYRLTVDVYGSVDPETGMVANFKEIKRVVRERIIDHLDHRHLNEIMEEVTTAENIVHWIAARLIPHLTGCRVTSLVLWETKTACVVLTEADLRPYEQPAAPIGPADTYGNTAG